MPTLPVGRIGKVDWFGFVGEFSVVAFVLSGFIYLVFVLKFDDQTLITSLI